MKKYFKVMFVLDVLTVFVFAGLALYTHNPWFYAGAILSAVMAYWRPAEKVHSAVQRKAVRPPRASHP